MTYSDLNAREKEFLSRINEARQRGPASYIAMVSILCAMQDKDLFGFAEQYTRGDFKRAIKEIREVQSGLPEYASHYEPAVAFIRRHWLHKEMVPA